MKATRTCSLPDCSRPHKGHGLCDLHRQRLVRTGTTDSPVRSQEERFWSHVDRRGADECWPWTGALTSTGYGALRPAGQHSGPVVKAHRYSAELAGLDITGRSVLHSCDNRPCVNPAHLHVGTHAENMAEMADRGRHVGFRKVTEADVYAIREAWAAGVARTIIAAYFGVSRANVGHITRRDTWANLPAVTPPVARDLVWAVVEALTGEAA